MFEFGKKSSMMAGNVAAFLLLSCSEVSAVRMEGAVVSACAPEAKAKTVEQIHGFFQKFHESEIVHLKGFAKDATEERDAEILEMLKSFQVLVWDGDAHDDASYSRLVGKFLELEPLPNKPPRQVVGFRHPKKPYTSNELDKWREKIGDDKYQNQFHYVLITFKDIKDAFKELGDVRKIVLFVFLNAILAFLRLIFRALILLQIERFRHFRGTQNGQNHQKCITHHLFWTFWFLWAGR